MEQDRPGNGGPERPDESPQAQSSHEAPSETAHVVETPNQVAPDVVNSTYAKRKLGTTTVARS